jgi:hypothetical protein
MPPRSDEIGQHGCSDSFVATGAAHGKHPKIRFDHWTSFAPRISGAMGHACVAMFTAPTHAHGGRGHGTRAQK